MRKTVYSTASKPIYDISWSEREALMKLAEFSAFLNRWIGEKADIRDLKILRAYLALPWWRVIKKYKCKRFLRRKDYAINMLTRYIDI